MKKKIIIIGAIAVVIIAAVIAVLLLGGKKVTITFDPDGGKSVSKITIKKGESAVLPKTAKEGFIFDGWYLNDERVTNSKTYDEDVTLKAKWISETAKVFTVTFDSAGGSKVSDVIVECDKELYLPTNPTRSGYTFVSWVDKNSTPIYDKALLACEDIVLTATWKKAESKKEESKKEETKTEENVRKYICPEGTLDGTKCIITKDVTEECPSGYQWSSSKNVCVTFTDQIKTCGDGTLTGDFCQDCIRPTQNTEEGCLNSPGNTRWYNGTCYCMVWEPETSCPDGYKYTVGGYYGWKVQKLSKCAKESQKTKTCPDGYTLENNQCQKIVDAIDVTDEQR